MTEQKVTQAIAFFSNLIDHDAEAWGWEQDIPLFRLALTARAEQAELESYRETKPDGKKLEMREGERSCENCGNTRCANSAVAYNWDECVDSNFTKHWMPKKEVSE